MADPWKLVIKNQCQEVYQYLTQPNTDPNKRITLENNLNILHVSISEQKHQIASMILKHPALKVDHPDLFGKTALHYAAANGDINAAKLL
jgi:ankyrin repeat protein